MLWQVTVTSTKPQSGKKRLLEERESVFAFLDRAKGTGQPVPWLVEPVGLVPRPVQHFGPKSLYFSVIFFSNTLARSLGKLLYQF